MARRYSGGIAVAALVCIGLSAQISSTAQTITQSFTIPGGTAIPFTDTFTFNKYNMALGGLVGVTLTLNASFLANIDIFNANNVSEPYTGASATTHVSFTGPGLQSEAFALVTTPQNGTAGPGLTVLANQSASKTAGHVVPAADFSFYEGAGTFTATGLAQTPTYSGSGPFLAFTGSNPTGGQVLTITYQYNPTLPEPGPMAFLFAGMLGSAGMLVRRRRKA